MTRNNTLAEPIPEALARRAKQFDSLFSNFLEDMKDAPPSLADAMRYAALGPGKRLRPLLVCECSRLVGGKAEASIPVAAAIECVHAFSLVHDDLPAMDASPVRRGRPTCHVRFGEAMAVLAGDALLARAFEILATDVPSSRRAVALIAELSAATGWQGMIAGQVADLEGESQPASRARVEQIHRFKTARLMEAACRMGAIIGNGDAAAMEHLGGYGRHLGLAFQIADDLLDVSGSAEGVGKPVRRDAAAGKQTYPACVGTEESRAAAARATEAAITELDPFGSEGWWLKELATYVAERAG